MKISNILFCLSISLNVIVLSTACHSSKNANPSLSANSCIPDCQIDTEAQNFTNLDFSNNGYTHTEKVPVGSSVHIIVNDNKLIDVRLYSENNKVESLNFNQKDD